MRCHPSCGDDGSDVEVAAARVHAAGRGDPPLAFFRVVRKGNRKRAHILYGT
jgi:hypothetical protein